MVEKFVGLLALLCVGISAYVMSGVSFLEGASGRMNGTVSNPGSGIFSFLQPIDITSVSGSLSDIFSSTPANVNIPVLSVSNLVEVVSGSGMYIGVAGSGFIRSAAALKIERVWIN